jgi:hypothetical protein
VVSVFGIIFASILGLIIGISRLSSNYLISNLLLKKDRRTPKEKAISTQENSDSKRGLGK